MNKYLGCLIILFSFCACQKQKNIDSLDQASIFFDHYKSRSNWQAFQDLYADDLVFEDVIYRLKYNKEEFINFYNWPDTLFQKHPDYPETLVLEEITTSYSSAVGRGYFNPFYYRGELMAMDHRWRFMISLEFNGQGKISRHTDFIEYPPSFLKAAAQGLLNQKENAR